MTPAAQGLVIGGDERTGARGWMEVVNPATALPIGRVANAGPGDARAALDVAARADHLRWAAGSAERIGGRAARAPRADGWHLTVRDPVGPCLLITPWNFPAAMVARKVGPATTIASVILGDPRLRKASFTGSTAVGRDVLQQSARNVLRASMELGGDAPFAVFDDADLDAALAGAVMAKLRNAGQACTAANRFYVHEPPVAAFAERLAAAFAGLRVGPGAEPGVDVGPLIDEPQRRRVTALVEDACRRGARVLTGGRSLNEPGYVYAPSVLVDVPANSRLCMRSCSGRSRRSRRFRRSAS